MSERPEPNLDRVREALREHDERAGEPAEAPEPPPPEDPPPDEPDETG